MTDPKKVYGTKWHIEVNGALSRVNIVIYGDCGKSIVTLFDVRPDRLKAISDACLDQIEARKDIEK